MTHKPQPRWNGEPCQARRITAIVADDSRFPQYWARHLVGTRRNAVEVTYTGQTFYIDDEDGSGWNKVTHGGSPHWGHSNLTIEPDSIQPCTEPSHRTGLRDEIINALGRIKTTPPVGHRQEQADHVLAVLYREWPWLRAEAEDASPVPAGLRNQIAAALYNRERPPRDPAWAEAYAADREVFEAMADAVLPVILPAARITATLGRMSEADVQRVVALYERWVKAGPPPLGTSVSRWWDRRLAELHDALLNPAKETDRA